MITYLSRLLGNPFYYIFLSRSRMEAVSDGWFWKEEESEAAGRVMVLAHPSYTNNNNTNPSPRAPL